MPVRSGDHGWIIDPGKKEKIASYGRWLCFHFQLYIDYGEICEDLYGRTLERFRTINANCGTASLYDRLYQHFWRDKLLIWPFYYGKKTKIQVCCYNNGHNFIPVVSFKKKAGALKKGAMHRKYTLGGNGI